MPRLARVVVPGYPHHVTQRGNRKAEVFRDDEDRGHYLALLEKYCMSSELDVWAYCLMPNHVHLVVMPRQVDSLSRALRDTHSRYASYFNRKYNETGHLWQGRYFSTALDDGHLIAAIHYVESNPTRAGLVDNALDYEWSSAKAHCGLSDDPLLSPVLEEENADQSWRVTLNQTDATRADDIRKATKTGRPCGTTLFTSKLESLLNRTLHKQKPGPRPK